MHTNIPARPVNAGRVWGDGRVSTRSFMKSADCRSHFLNLSPGKLTGLSQITDENGKFKVLAIDQIGSFQDAFRKILNREPTADEIRDGKLEMTRTLGV